MFAKFSQFQRWDLIAWCVVILGGAVLEGIGIARRSDVTFTYICRSTLPKWAMFGIVCFLAFHFLIQKNHGTH